MAKILPDINFAHNLTPNTLYPEGDIHHVPAPRKIAQVNPGRPAPLRKLGPRTGPCARPSPTSTPASVRWPPRRSRTVRSTGRPAELIAFAIGVAARAATAASPRTGRPAVKAGATEQEAAEAIGVTFLMHGGPATIHGARAYEVFREFVSEQAGQ